MEFISNYINGQQLAPVAGNYMDNVEPATGQIYAQIPNSTEQDLHLAIEAAEAAKSNWAKTPVEDRADVLMKISDLILENLDALAAAESRDNGKPISLATNIDIPRAASNFRFFAHACSQFASESHEMPGDAINYTLRQPLGIVGCISPWNLPLYLFTWKIAPALAAGNAVIAKPSEITPMTAYMLGKICQQAGLPNGVLNIIHGKGAQIGANLVEHPKVKGVSFTGGTQTGKAIAASIAGSFKKASLELGGKNPALVFADCDFDKTVAGIARAAFTNQGQICLCASRIYVERSIFESFKNALLKKIAQLNPADPANKETNFGALVSRPHMEKVLSYIELAKEEGGEVLTGGEQLYLQGRCEQGYFIAPTLIQGLSNNCRTNQEEIFGPVATIQPFDDEQQALELANDSQYGLAATVWTQDLNRAHRLGEHLQTGIVWVNCWLHRDLRTPFGGMKGSGLGREGGLEAMRFFTEPRNICIQYG